MLDLRYSTKFKRDYKAIIRRGYNPQLLQDILELLCNEQPLPPKYKDHRTYLHSYTPLSLHKQPPKLPQLSSSNRQQLLPTVFHPQAISVVVRRHHLRHVVQIDQEAFMDSERHGISSAVSHSSSGIQ